MAIACQGVKKKGDFSTLDKPFVESYNSDKSDSPQKTNEKKKTTQKSSFEVKQGLEIPISKTNVPSYYSIVKVIPLRIMSTHVRLTG